MSKEAENRYKTSRTVTCLTQEEAADLLGVAVRTLSDYENGHSKVPDDVVKRMAESYHNPMLALWHLKYNNPLGGFIPDIMQPQSGADVAFQLILAKDDFLPEVEIIKEIMRDGKVTEEEAPKLAASRESLKIVCGQILSAITYTEQMLQEETK